MPRVTNADGSVEQVNPGPWAIGEGQDYARKCGAAVEQMTMKASAYMVFAQLYIDTYPDTPITFDKWFRSLLEIDFEDDDNPADRPTETASGG